MYAAMFAAEMSPDAASPTCSGASSTASNAGTSVAPEVQQETCVAVTSDGYKCNAWHPIAEIENNNMGSVGLELLRVRPRWLVQ